MVWSRSGIINRDLEVDIGLPVTMKLSRGNLVGHNIVPPRDAPHAGFNVDVPMTFYRKVYEALRVGWAKNHSFLHDDLEDEHGLRVRAGTAKVDHAFKPTDAAVTQTP